MTGWVAGSGLVGGRHSWGFRGVRGVPLQTGELSGQLGCGRGRSAEAVLCGSGTGGGGPWATLSRSGAWPLYGRWRMGAGAGAPVGALRVAGDMAPPVHVADGEAGSLAAGGASVGVPELA